MLGAFVCKSTHICTLCPFELSLRAPGRPAVLADPCDGGGRPLSLDQIWSNCFVGSPAAGTSVRPLNALSTRARNSLERARLRLPTRAAQYGVLTVRLPI